MSTKIGGLGMTENYDVSFTKEYVREFANLVELSRLEPVELVLWRIRSGDVREP